MDLAKLFAEAKIKQKKTDKGVEISVDGRKVYTIVDLDGKDTRFVYPRGSEYTHTTHWGSPFSEKVVEKAMLGLLVGKLSDLYGKMH
jgi:hypothetical protein